MRIPDSQPPADDANSDRDDRRTTNRPDDNSPTGFAQLLAKKRSGSAEPEIKQRTGKESAGSFDAVLAEAAIPAGRVVNDPQAANAAEAPTAVAIPPQLQGLVHEIAVSVNAAGKHQVHIELNSSALQGLHIQIERSQSGVGIQFVAASDSVGALITRNMSALEQGLADRGVEVASIHVTSAAASGRSTSFEKSSGGQSAQRQRGR